MFGRFLFLGLFDFYYFLFFAFDFRGQAVYFISGCFVLIAFSHYILLLLHFYTTGLANVHCRCRCRCRCYIERGFEKCVSL